MLANAISWILNILYHYDVMERGREEGKKEVLNGESTRTCIFGGFPLVKSGHYVNVHVL